MGINGSVEARNKLHGQIIVPDKIHGKSAYELALLNGFEGTEVEWLASLKGYREEDKASYQAIVVKELKPIVVEELAKRGQLKPEFANSVKECTDTTKLYVLPDGMIYAYMYKESGNTYTNQLTEHQNGKYLSSTGIGTLSDSTDSFSTNFMPYTKGQVIRFKTTETIDFTASHTRLYFYDSAQATKPLSLQGNSTKPEAYFTITVEGDITTLTPIADMWESVEGVAFVQMSLAPLTDGAGVIITFDEEITENNTGGYSWQSTGHEFVTADYEERIVELEELTEIILDDLVILDDATRKNYNEIKELTGKIDGTGNTPDYWHDAIYTAVETVRQKQNIAGINAVSFVFTSDMHIHEADANSIPYEQNIGVVANNVMEKCNIPYFVTTGDITAQAAVTAGVPTSKESLYNDVEKFNKILSPIGKEKVIACLGNHDAMYGYADSESWIYTMSKEETFNFLFRQQTLDEKRVFSDDGTYFYVDIPSQKFRFIVLNSQWAEYTVDENGTPTFNRFEGSFYGQAQITWLAKTALDMPEGYTAAIFMHCAPVGANSDARYGKDYEFLAGVIKAYYDKTSYSGSYTGEEDWQNSSITVDYTAANGAICAIFCGHNHKDIIRQNGITGCPIIQITSAQNNDYTNTEDEPIRTAGTSAETAMDVVTIDKSNRKIYMTRLGVGENREVSY